MPNFADADAPDRPSQVMNPLLASLVPLQVWHNYRLGQLHSEQSRQSKLVWVNGPLHLHLGSSIAGIRRNLNRELKWQLLSTVITLPLIPTTMQLTMQRLPISTQFGACTEQARTLSAAPCRRSTAVRQARGAFRVSAQNRQELQEKLVRG